MADTNRDGTLSFQVHCQAVAAMFQTPDHMAGVRTLPEEFTQAEAPNGLHTCGKSVSEFRKGERDATAVPCPGTGLALHEHVRRRSGLLVCLTTFGSLVKSTVL